MLARHLLGGFSVLLATVASIPGEPVPADPGQAKFSKLSGVELVQLLLEQQSRPRAFYELWRRAHANEDTGLNESSEEHYDAETVVCPQGERSPPIYLVLCGFMPRNQPSTRKAYGVDKPDELFPPLPEELRYHGAEGGRLMEAFASDGRYIKPFGNNNVVHEPLRDLNGDGLIEHVDMTPYGVEGIKNVDVLTVSTVREKAEPLFILMLNWGNEEWTYRVVDQDADGLFEIEAGPRSISDFKAKARWKWDVSKKEFVGPTGVTGDHFRVIDGHRPLWAQLEEFKSAELVFPKDMDAVVEASVTQTTGRPTPVATTISREPYHYSSLKEASDAELFRFMSAGKSEIDREYEAKNPSHVPEDFWTLDAKSAALAFVNANRTELHRASYEIAIDDRDKAEPPAQCTISLSYFSARCYNAIDGNFFLRVDPEDSYLACAQSWAGGEAFYNAVHDQPAFDFRLCPLRNEDARKIANVIWWLNRIRSRSKQSELSSSSSISSADGGGKVVLRSGSEVLIEVGASRWADHLGERWSHDYDRETFLNFATYLLMRSLPDRLGHEWSKFEPKHSQDIEAREKSAPIYDYDEQKQLSDLSLRFLDWYTPGQEKISNAIVAEAARLAGEFAIDSAAERLRAIEATLPPAGPKPRTYEQISAKLKSLPDEWTVKDRERRKRIEQERTQLETEQDWLVYDRGVNTADHLRKRTALALREIATADDTDKLYTWAVSKSPGAQWAMQRLALVDRKRYSGALETWMHRENKWERQFFEELAKTDPARATAIANRLSPETKDALAISAFLLLNESGRIPDERKRMSTIIKILHNPKSGWEERGRAIELLVPTDEPMRYPGRDVDNALLKLLESQQADGTTNFTLAEACRALARRGRKDLFERIANQLSNIEDAYTYERVLGALTHLAQTDPQQFNPRLLAILRPHLLATNKNMTEVFWAIWSADLRELQPELERLATHGVDEYEDGKAQSSGGNITSVSGPFHFARKIVSLWSEPDPLSRARLLIAFAIKESSCFAFEPVPERVIRMKSEMHRVAAELTPEAKIQLRSFLDRIKADPPLIDSSPIDPEIFCKVIALAGETLGID